MSWFPLKIFLPSFLANQGAFNNGYCDDSQKEEEAKKEVQDPSSHALQKESRIVHTFSAFLMTCTQDTRSETSTYLSFYSPGRRQANPSPSYSSAAVTTTTTTMRSEAQLCCFVWAFSHQYMHVYCRYSLLLLCSALPLNKGITFLN